jgi:hypothetical protein
LKIRHLHRVCAYNVCDLEPVREPGAGLQRFNHWLIKEIVYQSPVTSIEIPCRAVSVYSEQHTCVVLFIVGQKPAGRRRTGRRQATLETTPLRTAIAEP